MGAAAVYETEMAILNNIFSLFNVSSYVVDLSGNILLEKSSRFGMDAIGSDSALLQELMNVCQTPNEACVYYDAPKFYFLVYRTDSLLFLFGPICERAPSEREIQAYLKEHMLEKRQYSTPVEDEQKVCAAVNLLRLIYGDRSSAWKRLERDRALERAQEIVRYKYQKFSFDYQHIPFTIQKEWMEAIRTGDVETLFKISEIGNVHDIGILAPTELKQAEYCAVSSVVIANLAAIEGGVDSAQAYELSDVFLQRLGSCDSASAYEAVIRDATLAYVELVKKKRNPGTNYHVSRCKDYISMHIQENIKVSALAEREGLDESYLGRLFKESEGITIKEYVHQEKMKIAAEMLLNSDASITEISDFLGFHSKSYFGEIFLRTYHMTPLIYRMTNKVV